MSLLLAIALSTAASPVKLDQTGLDALTDACRAPRDMLKYNGGKQVELRAPSDMKFEMIDCVLTRLHSSAIPIELSFIGNAQVSEKR